jgi:hypothetical protein
VVAVSYPVSFAVRTREEYRLRTEGQLADHLARPALIAVTSVVPSRHYAIILFVYLLYLFTYGLCSNAVSSLDYVASNGLIITGIMRFKLFSRKW